MSLLVKVLHGMEWAPTSVHKIVLGDLLLLWRADDNPRRTYAEALQQLEALKKSPRFQNVRVDFFYLEAEG